MTQTQLQYLNYLESVRANQAREALNARQIDEVQRANVASEGIRGDELTERKRAAEVSEDLKAQELEMNATVNAARNALFGAQTDAAQLENVLTRLYQFDDQTALTDYGNWFLPEWKYGENLDTVRDVENFYNVTRPSEYVQRAIGGTDNQGSKNLMDLVTKLIGLLS